MSGGVRFQVSSVRCQRSGVSSHATGVRRCEVSGSVRCQEVSGGVRYQEVSGVRRCQGSGGVRR